MKPSVKSCGVQATCQTMPASVQCHRYNHTQTAHTESDSDIESDMDISPPDQGHDSEWSPSEEDYSDLEGDVMPVYKFDSDETDPDKALKYVVFEQSLFELLDICPVCSRRNLQHIKTTVRTCVCIISRCACGFLRKWKSQPFSNSMPWGNLVIACGIFFSENSPVKTFNFMSHSGILGPSQTAHNKLQRAYIVPATLSCWQFQQSVYLNDKRNSGSSLKLGGDARCNSLGHNAKYGSYTLMNVETAKVVDVQLVQSNEVKNSYAMELEGLKHCFQFLKDEGIPVSDLVTDRHCQVNKLMKCEYPDVNHWVDVWHVAKGVYKKLEALDKSKKCAVAGEWARFISNHAYWCAASSGCKEELVRQKWTSILNQVANIHEGHRDLFHSCEHGSISRKWIKTGSKVFQEMQRIVCGKLLVKDIRKLSPAQQTSCLESFHNVVNYYAPKASHFFYNQMKARLCLAALHFNANSSRLQATLEDGTARYRIAFPKGRKGDAVPKEIKVKQNFDYITELKEDVVIRQLQFTTIQQAKAALAQEMDAPPPSIASQLCGAMGNFDRDAIIHNHCQRFTSYVRNEGT